MRGCEEREREREREREGEEMEKRRRKKKLLFQRRVPVGPVLAQYQYHMVLSPYKVPVVPYGPFTIQSTTWY